MYFEGPLVEYSTLTLNVTLNLVTIGIAAFV